MSKTKQPLRVCLRGDRGFSGGKPAAPDRVLRFKLARKAYNGRDWTAQAHIAFHNETGASIDQICRALTLLRKQDFIKSEQHMFQGKNINHFWLTDKGEAVFAECGGVGKSAHLPTEGGPQICAPGVGKSAYPGVGKIAVLNRDSLISHTNSQTSLGGLKPSEKFEECEINSVSEEENQMNLKSMLGTSPELMKKAFEKTHNPDKKLAYEIAWKKGVGNHTGAYVSDISALDRKKLHAFVKTCPAGKAHDILDFVLSAWGYFAENAKVAAGLKGYPADPSVGFLLVHRAQAIALWDKAQKKAAQKVEAEIKPCYSPPMQVNASPEPEGYANPTMAEIFAQDFADDE